MDIQVYSETDKLQAVLLHEPGPEIENMTPENAERALYSDILNLPVAKQEYAQFHGVLKKISKVYLVTDLLKETLVQEPAKNELIYSICQLEGTDMQGLQELPPDLLANILVEGLLMEKDTLSKFLSDDRFALMPLHNFFFTRDPSFTIHDEIFISRMAKPVRARESVILESIFHHHPLFKHSKIVNLQALTGNTRASIEGGDIQVVNDRVILAGLGARTNSAGIDMLVEHFKQKNMKKEFIVQVLPKSPESFIHLDMVFTILGKHECLVYEPFLKSRFPTIRISIDQGGVKITEVLNILDGLQQVGLDFEPAFCGGRGDSWVQEREQWHSGANFLSFGPGQVIGYARNNYTFDELSKKGYQVIPAKEMIQGTKETHPGEKIAVALDGSELPRGGGGARCMSMPLNRV